MISPLIRIVVLINMLFLSGCATKHIVLDRAVVRNDTAWIITEVKVLHEPTGKTGFVNMILPQRSLELGFAGQPMLAKEAIITWKDHEGWRRKAKVDLPDNRDASGEEQTNSLVYTIKPAGDVRVHLEHSGIK